MRTTLLSLGLWALTLMANAAPPDGVWRASIENGDKPGVGIELRLKGGVLSGTLFVIDPNKPHDFNSGTSYPMRFDKTAEKEIVFTVNFAAQNIQSERLVLATPLNQEQVHAVLEPVPANGSKQDYHFRRIK